ncbi:hypothetical protein AK830_g9508 [Neonectria ditissima]|uniref:Uncharacterized protein n=1 Tax=Neonectria ditissima TaxID=78410 RepID=A0A0P7AHX3_9HYPO|nr:hypothetical protein AK830_g9508 [Neonectria ditissima]
MEDRKDGKFLGQAPASDASDHEHPRIPAAKRRQATVYDAVAGKVSYSQGLPNDDPEPLPPNPRTIKYSTKGTPLAPDEVLFRRQGAPERYMEHDIYFAHEQHLPRAGQGVLPESDLLKAIHGYTSAFYSSKTRASHAGNDASVAARSMDETALLAFGILLEEAGKEVLGRRGDLVFTEGADDTLGSGTGGDDAAREEARIVGRHDVAIHRKRGPKRQKVADTDED